MYGRGCGDAGGVVGDGSGVGRSGVGVGGRYGHWFFYGGGGVFPVVRRGAAVSRDAGDECVGVMGGAFMCGVFIKEVEIVFK